MLFRSFICFSVYELKVPKVPYLEMGGSNVFLYRNLRFQRIPIQKRVVPMFFCFGTEGSKGSLFRNGWFQWFSVWELKVATVPYLEMGGSNVFLFRN